MCVIHLVTIIRLVHPIHFTLLYSIPLQYIRPVCDSFCGHKHFHNCFHVWRTNDSNSVTFHERKKTKWGNRNLRRCVVLSSQSVTSILAGSWHYLTHRSRSAEWHRNNYKISASIHLPHPSWQQYSLELYAIWTAGNCPKQNLQIYRNYKTAWAKWPHLKNGWLGIIYRLEHLDLHHYHPDYRPGFGSSINIPKLVWN